VSSDFHLLLRYLQNIYIFSAAHETYIKTTRCLNRRGLEKPETDSVGQSTPRVPVAWFVLACEPTLFQREPVRRLGLYVRSGYKIIIIIMNYISTWYNFTYTKINYVQNIKRKKGDLPTGRAHTSRNKK
jgi:hypothetical protein